MKIDNNWNKKGLITMLSISVLCIIGVGIKAAYSVNGDPINSVISNGLDECSTMHNERCVGVMVILDEICQNKFFESCFGERWTSFMDHLKNFYKKNNLDDYVTINNEHFGTDPSNK